METEFRSGVWSVREVDETANKLDVAATYFHIRWYQEVITTVV